MNADPTVLDKRQSKLVSKEIRGVEIEATHRPGVRQNGCAVKGLSRLGADKTFFTMVNGEKVSIAQYFKKVYDITLSFPKLP